MKKQMYKFKEKKKYESNRKLWMAVGGKHVAEYRHMKHVVSSRPYHSKKNTLSGASCQTADVPRPDKFTIG